MTEFVLKWTSIELRQCFEDLVSFLCQKCLQKDFPEPPVVSRFLQNLKDVLRVLAKHVAFPSEVCSVMERRTRRDRFESSISSSSFHCVSADCSLSPTVQATFSDSGDSSVDVYHFCKSHYYVADRLYSLYHMNSNMLLNIRNRVIKKEIAYWSPSIKFTREKDLEDDGFNRCILDSLVSYYCCIISDLSPKKTDSRPKHVNTVLELFDKEAVQWEVALGAEPPPTSSGINYVSFYIPRKKKPTSEHSISKKRRSVFMYTGLRSGNKSRSGLINNFEYRDAVRSYAKQMPFYGPNLFLEDKLKLMRLNELTINDRFSLPYCHFGCAAVDYTENKFMVCGASNGDVYVVDLDEAALAKKSAIAVHKKRPVTRDGHKNRVIGCEWFKNDAASFITCSRDDTVKLWDTAHFEVVDTYKVGYEGHSVAQVDWNGIDPYLIAVALNSSVVKFVDSGVGSSVQQIRWKSKHISCVKWYPSNGHYLFVGTTEGAAGFFDIRQSKLPVFELRDRKYSAFESRVEKAKFTRDGTKIIIMSADLSLKGFSMDNGEIEIKKMPGVGQKRPTSPIFDLCEEAGHLYGVIPCKRKIKLTRLERTKNVDLNMVDDFDAPWRDDAPVRPLDRLTSYEIGEDLFLDGFLGDAMGAVYRSGKQHIVGYGTTESALVFTPKCDILTIENRAGPNPEDLHVDDWSSDEGF